MSAMTRRAVEFQGAAFPYISDVDLRKLRAWADHRSQTRDASVTEDADRAARRAATSVVYQVDVALGTRRARPGGSRRQSRERCVELAAKYDSELRQHALAQLAAAPPATAASPGTPGVAFPQLPPQLTEEQLRSVRRWICDRTRRQIATASERIVHHACNLLLNPTSEIVVDRARQQALHAQVTAYVDHAQVPGIDLELPVPSALREQVWRCVTIAVQRKDDVLLKQCVAALGGGQIGARSRAVVIATLQETQPQNQPGSK